VTDKQVTEVTNGDANKEHSEVLFGEDADPGVFTQGTLELLKRSINPSYVKRHRQGYDYLETQLVIDTLNNIFKWGWSFEVKETIQGNSSKTKNNTPMSHFRVLGRLTVQTNSGDVLVKEDWGAAGNTNSKFGSADECALKSATSDSLKRCARMLGTQFGLGLYGDLTDQGDPPETNGITSKKQAAVNLRKKVEKVFSNDQSNEVFKLIRVRFGASNSMDISEKNLHMVSHELNKRPDEWLKKMRGRFGEKTA
jgi:hypothetical protein